MLGLSAQDSNIQGIFNKAANELTWQLGDPPPSYVFSEQELGMDQRSLLRNVYRDQITPANLTAVFEAARIQAYAKRLLTALLLDMWSRKLQALIPLAPGPLPLAERQHVCAGIVTLRNRLADAAEPELGFIGSAGPASCCATAKSNTPTSGLSRSRMTSWRPSRAIPRWELSDCAKRLLHLAWWGWA